MGQTIGYREWQGYFENGIDKKTVIQHWKFHEHNYARRQMTWFRKKNNINWFAVSNPDFQEQVEMLVKSWYS